MRRQFQRIIYLSLFVLGFSSIFTQIYFLREFLTVFQGNELVIGIVLSSWMFLTGLGAWLGRFFYKIRGRLGFVLFLQLLIALLPLLTVIKIDLWKFMIFPPGMEPGLMQIIYAAFLLQLPFCLVNGFLFIAYTSILTGYSNENRAGKSYSLESFGSLFGGVIVNFILLWFLGTFQSLLILITINLISISIFLSLFKKIWLKVFLIVISLMIFGLIRWVDLQGVTRRLLFPEQNIVYDKTTPYGAVIVTENAGQLNFYENGVLQFSSGNEIFNEEAVHYAMVQHPDPKNILLIGGGISGVMDEILKYHPVLIDYFELNPAVTMIGKEIFKTLKNPVIRIHNEDGRNYIRKKNEKYDVALINLSEPSTLQINRYFTFEFFKLMKTHLSSGGILSVSLPSTADYVSETAGKTNSILLSTLTKEYNNVIIIPGLKNYFLASDSALSSEISRLISDKKFSTLYVNPYYLDDNLLKERSNFIMRHLNKSDEINRDFKPAGYFYQLQYWTTFYKTNYLILAIIVILFMVFILFNLNRVNIGLFTGGFTASSIEIFLLLSFQIMNGYLFIMAGIIITLFMAGLAVGSALSNKIFPHGSVKDYIRIQVSIAIYTLAFPFIILGINDFDLPSLINIPVTGFLTLLISCLTGIEFTLTSEIQKKDLNNVVAKNYSVDLFGASIGVLLTTILFLPLFGIVNTCLILVFINLSGALVLFISFKK